MPSQAGVMGLTPGISEFLKYGKGKDCEEKSPCRYQWPI